MADSDVQSREPIETQWAGVTKWDCPFCPQDRYDRAEMVAHIDFAHPEPGLSVPDAMAAEQAAPVEAPAPESPIAAAPQDAPVETPMETPMETPAHDESSSDEYEKG
jgi:hypothetical protein